MRYRLLVLICDRLLLFSLILLITNTWILQSRHYLINDNSINGYMYHEFENVSEEIFPADLAIKFSLSRFVGTLLYSKDSNKNQLNVSIFDGIMHGLHIELNKRSYTVSFYRLCECEDCLYKILNIRIKIGEYLYVQCNKENFRVFSKENNKHKDATTNKAKMWLVNNPLNPLKDYVRGCIFEVSYNNRPLQMANVSSNVGRECHKTCTETICNGGLCYEDYNGEQICDCSATFNNGRYCNKSVPQTDIQLFDQFLKFESIKVSWDSNGTEILTLKNTKLSIGLGRHNQNLFLEVMNLFYENITYKVNLTSNYVQNREYICIMSFYINRINVQLCNNGSWDSIVIPVEIDIREETFDHLNLESSGGYIGMVHKRHRDYVWKDINIINTMIYNTGNATYQVIILTVIGAVIGSIGFIYLWSKDHFNKTGKTTLHWACHNGHLYIVMILLEKGAKMDTVDNTGKTTLHWACHNGHLYIVMILLKTGAKMETVDNTGKNALHWACYNGHLDIVMILLEKGAKMDTVDNTGNTALHWACYNGHLDIVMILLERGANMETEDNNGNTALHWACYKGHLDIVMRLVERGADVETGNHNGNTKLHRACYYGHGEIVMTLLDRGAKMETADKEGDTALHYACIKGHVEIVKTLLDRGANMETWDNNGDTALHCACNNDNVDIVETMLERGANIDTLNNKGETPWGMARQSNKTKCLILLQKFVNRAVDKALDNDLEWTERDNRFIERLSDCNEDFVMSTVVTFIEEFNKSYKSEVIKQIEESVDFTTRMKIVINCLCTSLNCVSTNDSNDTLISLLEELYPYISQNVIVLRISEIILYNICKYRPYKSKEKKDRLIRICIKYSSANILNEEIQISSIVLICHSTNNITDNESNMDRAETFLSDIIRRMHHQSVAEYLGFCKEEIKKILNQIDLLTSEHSERKYVNECMNTIGWSIVTDCDTDSVSQWKEFIVGQSTTNLFTDLRLNSMYNGLREAIQVPEYFRDIITMMIHVRLFVLQSTIEESQRTNNQSVKYLMELLFDKYNHKSCPFTGYLLECMMDFLEDFSTEYGDNASFIAMVDSISSFVVYYTLINNYEHERDMSFFETFKDNYNMLWPAVIKCLCKEGNRYGNNLRDFLDSELMNEGKVTKDMIVVYSVLTKINYAEWIGDMDYRLVVALRECEILPEENITSTINTIIDTFRNDIIHIKNDVTDLNKCHVAQIHCVCECIKYKVVYRGETPLSLLDELYLCTTSSMATMRIVEIIFYNMCLYKQYLMTEYKDRIRNICLKYWNNNTISDEARFASSVMLCHTIFDVNDAPHIVNVVGHLSDIVQQESRDKNGFSADDILSAITKAMVNMTILRNSTILRTESLDAKIKEMTTKSNMTGVMIVAFDDYNRWSTDMTSVASPYFYSHKDGYKLKLQLDPRSDRLLLKLYLSKGEYDDHLSWPCDRSFTIGIIDQLSGETRNSRTIRYGGRDGGERLTIDNTLSIGNMSLRHEILRSTKGIIVNESIMVICNTH